MASGEQTIPDPLRAVVEARARAMTLRRFRVCAPWFLEDLAKGPPFAEDVTAAEATLAADQALPLAERVALARALVPECAVVPREATEAMRKAARSRHVPSDGAHIYDGIYRAMIAAAEAERDG